MPKKEIPQKDILDFLKEKKTDGKLLSEILEKFGVEYLDALFMMQSISPDLVRSEFAYSKSGMETKWFLVTP